MNNTTTYKTYIADAKRSECDYIPAIGRVVNPKTLRLLHAAMGMVDEAAEFQKNLKNYIFYGKPMDPVNMKEEVGDNLWFQAIAADELGERNFTNIMQKNIAKLRARYEKKFSELEAVTRDLDAERKILDGQ